MLEFWNVTVPSQIIEMCGSWSSARSTATSKPTANPAAQESQDWEEKGFFQLRFNFQLCSPPETVIRVILLNLVIWSNATESACY